MHVKPVRYQNQGCLHFITFICYRRMKLLDSAAARDTFERELERVSPLVWLLHHRLRSDAGARAPPHQRTGAGKALARDPNAEASHLTNAQACGGLAPLRTFYLCEKPAAPAFMIFEGWVSVLIDPGDLDGMTHDPA